MFWWLWLVCAFVFVVLEIAIPSTFFFFCLAIGAVLSSMTSAFRISIWLDFSIFAIFSLLSVFVIKPLFKNVTSKRSVFASNVDSLVGKIAVVTEKIAVSKSGFIKIDGEIWLATSNTFGFEVGEKVKIEITNGNVAVVVKHLE